MYSQFDPYAANVNAIKGYFKNKKVMALGIMYILSIPVVIAMTVIFAVTLAGQVNDIASLNFSGTYMEELGRGVFTAVTNTMIGFMVVPIAVSLVISFLRALGNIKMYRRSRSEAGSPRSGATILFVLAIIDLASVVLPCLLMIPGIAILLMGSSSTEFREALNSSGINNTQLIISMALVGVLMVFVIIYSVMQLRFYNSVRMSMRSVELRSSGAGAFGVMNIIYSIIIAAAAVLSAITAFTTTEILGAEAVTFNILAIVEMLISLISYILLAAIALGYKKYINNMKFGYSGAGHQAVDNAEYPPAREPEPIKPQLQKPEFDMQKNPYTDLFASIKAPEEGIKLPKAEKESFEDLFDAPAEPEDDALAENAPDEPEITAAPVCPECGSAVPEGSVFCNHCGKKL